MVTTAKKQFQSCSHWFNRNTTLFVNVWTSVQAKALHYTPSTIWLVGQWTIVPGLPVLIIESIFNSTASNLCSIAPVYKCELWMWMWCATRQMCKMNCTQCIDIYIFMSGSDELFEHAASRIWMDGNVLARMNRISMHLHCVCAVCAMWNMHPSHLMGRSKLHCNQIVLCIYFIS